MYNILSIIRIVNSFMKIFSTFNGALTYKFLVNNDSITNLKNVNIDVPMNCKDILVSFSAYDGAAVVSFSLNINKLQVSDVNLDIIHRTTAAAWLGQVITNNNKITAYGIYNTTSGSYISGIISILYK